MLTYVQPTPVINKQVLRECMSTSSKSTMNNSCVLCALKIQKKNSQNLECGQLSLPQSSDHKYVRFLLVRHVNFEQSYTTCGQYGSFFKFFIQIFVVGSERCTCFETECVMALRGQPRPLILAPIESVSATSYIGHQ